MSRSENSVLKISVCKAKRTSQVVNLFCVYLLILLVTVTVSFFLGGGGVNSTS